jgi:hypothetical protein
VPQQIGKVIIFWNRAAIEPLLSNFRLCGFTKSEFQHPTRLFLTDLNQSRPETRKETVISKYDYHEEFRV